MSRPALTDLGRELVCFFDDAEFPLIGPTRFPGMGTT